MFVETKLWLLRLSESSQKSDQRGPGHLHIRPRKQQPFEGTAMAQGRLRIKT